VQRRRRHTRRAPSAVKETADRKLSLNGEQLPGRANLPCGMMPGAGPGDQIALGGGPTSAISRTTGSGKADGHGRLLGLVPLPTPR
jgi:hypothetical protein